jgi:hypothetical protein
MFCMGCGAETPPRASACPVCGRPLGAGAASRPDETRPQAGIGPRSSATEAEAERHTTQRQQTAVLHPGLGAARATSAPSISSGDLATTGFPRDTLGRAVIFTVLAMCADLVAPWVMLDGERIAPSTVGLPILGAVVVLGLAAVPVIRPSLRATPLYAAAPLAIGAASFGAAGAVWLRTALSSGAADVNSSSPLRVANFAFSPVYIADVGLYLFLAGAVVLVCIGYQLFLAAARASALAELRATAPAPVLAATRSAVPAAATAVAPASAPSIALASAEPTAAPVGPQTGDGGGGTAHADSPPPSANGHRDQKIALPGSPAWGQAPALPAYQRPSSTLGWRRRGP